MTDEQILEMIRMEKSAIDISRQTRSKGELIIVGCFDEIRDDFTSRIDHAHFEQEAG